MNKRIFKAMLKKDFKGLRKSRKTWVPMLMSTILLCIIIPVIIAYLGTYTDTLVAEDETVNRLTDVIVQQMPDGKAKEKISSLNSLSEKFTFFFLNYMAISMFIMVAVINSMVTATSSFVGEKERGTLETLLFSPISIKDMFISKIIASFVPSITLTYGAFILTFTIINLMLYPVYGILFMFNSLWAVLLLWLIPIVLLFTILINVLISSKTKTFQEAQQLGGLLVLPIVGFIITQSVGLIFINTITLILAGSILLVVSMGLLSFIIKWTSRNKLFENQI